MVDTRAELEAAIEADPYDARAYAVYGDFLHDLGDPRGELIALQLANAADPDPRLDTATRALFHRYPTLLPSPVKGHLQWRHGFIQRAELAASEVPIILDHPSSRFLTELVIFHAWDMSPAIGSLSQRTRPALRRLEVGHQQRLDPQPPPEPPPIGFGAGGRYESLEPLWVCLPNLERLECHGIQDVGALDLPRLVALVQHTTRPEPFMAAVAGAVWPALERFDLEVQMVACDGATIDHLRRFLVETPAPELAHLGLRRARRLLFDALGTAIGGPALARIRSLDLTGDLLLDDDLRPLVESGLRFDRIDVSRNQLTADGIAALSKIATTVIADDQVDPADDPIEGLYDY